MKSSDGQVAPAAPRHGASYPRPCLAISLVLLVMTIASSIVSVSRDSVMLVTRQHPSPLDWTRKVITTTSFKETSQGIQLRSSYVQTYQGAITGSSTQPMKYGRSRGGNVRMRNYLLIYNNVPKCASRSLAFSIKSLFKERGFGMDPVQIGDNKNYTLLREAYETAKPPGFIGGHMPFRHLRREDVVRINMIRDPVDRYVSNYYFSKYGDVGGTRPDNISQLERETIDQYIAGGGTVEETMLQFFMEDNERNRNLSGADAVQACKANIEHYYTFVGLLEEFQTTIRLLERLLPQLLHGLEKTYNSKKKAFKRKHSTKNKEQPSNKTRAILRQKLKHEYDLYYFVKKKFHRLVEEFGM